MNNLQIPVARKEGLVIQEVSDEILVYDLETNKAHCLNQTAATVWKNCDGQKSVADISKIFGSQSGSSIDEDLVWLALDQLKKEKLIANGEEVISDFAGMSRREVIKKVGLGTMIALPLVSSLVAPTAANAQSTCVNAICTCTSPGSVVGSGNPCAAPNTGGCSTTFPGCTCRADNNGNNLSGHCSA